MAEAGRDLFTLFFVQSQEILLLSSGPPGLPPANAFFGLSH
jgi:hypothetical protein